MSQPYYGAYAAFTNHFQQISLSHNDVMSYGIGEVDDYSVTGEDNYPRVFLELPIQNNFEMNAVEFRAAFTVTQQTLLERDDEQTKINTCWDIANDLMFALNDPASAGLTALTGNYFLNPNFNFITLTRFKDDFTAGVRVEFSVKRSLPINNCLLPNSFSTPCDSTISPVPMWLGGCSDGDFAGSDTFTFTGINCPVKLRFFIQTTNIPQNQKPQFVYALNATEIAFNWGNSYFDVEVNNGDEMYFYLSSPNNNDLFSVWIPHCVNLNTGQDYGEVLPLMSVYNNQC